MMILISNVFWIEKMLDIPSSHCMSVQSFEIGSTIMKFHPRVLTRPERDMVIGPPSTYAIISKWSCLDTREGYTFKR